MNSCFGPAFVQYFLWSFGRNLGGHRCHEQNISLETRVRFYLLHWNCLIFGKAELRLVLANSTYVTSLYGPATTGLG